MYSQNSEELFIVDYFKDTVGKFIDIGAFHVFQFSNTRKLYESGWNGVLVEPAPANYKGIKDHYNGDGRITVLNVAIGESNEEIDFYESADAVSTSDPNHMNKWAAAGVGFNKIKVQQVNVIDFMNEYGKGTDFLSIDTEATNMSLFRHIPGWVFDQIKMICIEHDLYYAEISERLDPYGFKTLHLNAENIILAK